MRPSALTAKPLVALIALAALGPCSGGGPDVIGPSGELKGTWGGENAALIADDTSAHVHIGCTYGNISQLIVPDDRGRFDVPGVQNITAHPVDLGVLHPARFTGRIIGGGRQMELTVRLTDTTVTLGPVQLMYGKEPRMGPCPICRPGMDRATP